MLDLQNEGTVILQNRK